MIFDGECDLRVVALLGETERGQLCVSVRHGEVGALLQEYIHNVQVAALDGLSITTTGKQL